MNGKFLTDLPVVRSLCLPLACHLEAQVVVAPRFEGTSRVRACAHPASATSFVPEPTAGQAAAAEVTE